MSETEDVKNIVNSQPEIIWRYRSGMDSIMPQIKNLSEVNNTIDLFNTAVDLSFLNLQKQAQYNIDVLITTKYNNDYDTKNALNELKQFIEREKQFFLQKEEEYVRLYNENENNSSKKNQKLNDLFNDEQKTEAEVMRLIQKYQIHMEKIQEQEQIEQEIQRLERNKRAYLNAKTKKEFDLDQWREGQITEIDQKITDLQKKKQYIQKQLEDDNYEYDNEKGKDRIIQQIEKEYSTLQQIQENIKKRIEKINNYLNCSLNIDNTKLHIYNIYKQMSNNIESLPEEERKKKKPIKTVYIIKLLEGFSSFNTEEVEVLRTALSVLNDGAEYEDIHEQLRELENKDKQTQKLELCYMIEEILKFKIRNFTQQSNRLSDDYLYEEEKYDISKLYAKIKQQLYKFQHNTYNIDKQKFLDNVTSFNNLYKEKILKLKKKDDKINNRSKKYVDITIEGKPDIAKIELENSIQKMIDRYNEIKLKVQQLSMEKNISKEKIEQLNQIIEIGREQIYELKNKENEALTEKEKIIDELLRKIDSLDAIIQNNKKQISFQKQQLTDTINEKNKLTSLNIDLQNKPEEKVDQEKLAKNNKSTSLIVTIFTGFLSIGSGTVGVLSVTEIIALPITGGWVFIAVGSVCFITTVISTIFVNKYDKDIQIAKNAKVEPQKLIILDPSSYNDQSTSKQMDETQIDDGKKQEYGYENNNKYNYYPDEDENNKYKNNETDYPNNKTDYPDEDNLKPNYATNGNNNKQYLQQNQQYKDEQYNDEKNNPEAPTPYDDDNKNNNENLQNSSSAPAQYYNNEEGEDDGKNYTNDGNNVEQNTNVQTQENPYRKNINNSEEIETDMNNYNDQNKQQENSIIP